MRRIPQLQAAEETQTPLSLKRYKLTFTEQVRSTKTTEMTAQVEEGDIDRLSKTFGFSSVLK